MEAFFGSDRQILLGSVHALFLKGSLRWRIKRKIADWLTFTFSFAKQAFSSASVLSGCSATSFLTRSVCGTSAKVLWPPNLAGLTLPVSRLRLMNPPTVLKAKLYNSATSSRVCPDSIAATARSRRSSEYGFAIHDWPPCPSGNLESDSCLLGNPSRFDLPGKCSSGHHPGGLRGCSGSLGARRWAMTRRIYARAMAQHLAEKVTELWIRDSGTRLSSMT